MPDLSKPRPARRRGIGAIEVIVVSGVLVFFGLLLLIGLPRWRETSRMAGCQRNMMQLGVAVQLYHQANLLYPGVQSLRRPPGPSPVALMLDALVLPDFLELHDPKEKPKGGMAAVAGTRLPGMSCPSDPGSRSGAFASTISYRANTGDGPGGQDGPFEPGRPVASADVEANDGLSFTASFAERLIGDGQDGRPSLPDYASVNGPITRAGRPDGPQESWRGDAGSSWAVANWRDTLYNHSLVPNSPLSCISDDHHMATMGASSSHPNRVNVLMLDGSLRGVTPSISPEVWRGMATIAAPMPR